MIEEWCKIIFGQDVWGIGMFFVFVLICCLIPLTMALSEALIEVPKICNRLRALEDDNHTHKNHIRHLLEAEKER